MYFMIKSTLYLNLLIFTFVIIFLLCVATALANSLVTSSKLDYCNSLYFGISQANLNKLRRIQNHPLASVIVNTSKYRCIAPLLKNLHWLPIKQRIHYKICLLTYKTLENHQPTYLHNSLSFPSNSVSTRSSDSLVLSILFDQWSLDKKLSLSLVQDSGIHSFLIPKTGLLCQFNVRSSKHTFSKLRFLLRLFPISFDCLPAFWLLIFLYFMPYRLTLSETSSDANITQVDYVPPWLRKLRDQSIDNSFGFDWDHGCKC